MSSCVKLSFGALPKRDLKFIGMIILVLQIHIKNWLTFLDILWLSFPIFTNKLGFDILSVFSCLENINPFYLNKSHIIMCYVENESGIIAMSISKADLNWVKKSRKKIKLCYTRLPNSRAGFGEFSAERFYCK